MDFFDPLLSQNGLFWSNKLYKDVEKFSSSKFSSKEKEILFKKIINTSPDDWLVVLNFYEACLNNSYLSGFYGEQYINQLYNIGKKPVILSFDKVADSILNITKAKFIKFIKKLLIFPNMKLAYQGKEEQEGLEKLVLNKIK